MRLAMAVVVSGLIAVSSQATMAGTLTENGEPVAGVTISVSRDGSKVGAAVTAEDGSWEVPLPGPGAYDVTIDPETLPEGVALRDPSRTTLDGVEVRAGQRKVVLFPLGPGSAAGSRSAVDRILDLTANGVKIGAIVALAAIGLSLIFGVTGLVNFAHGELVTFGAVAAFFFNATASGPQLPLLVAAVLAVLTGGVLGFTLEAGLFRPLRRRRTGNVTLIVVSIGLSLLLRHLILIVYGGRPRPYADFTIQRAVSFGPFTLPPKDFVIIGLAFAVLVLVGLFLQTTRTGTAMRAVSDSRDLAASTGIDVERIILITWVGGGALAALGGVLIGLTNSVNWDSGYSLLLPMFAAVILGGLGTAYGAMVGALLIGVVSQVSTYWFPIEFRDVIALGILIAVLMVRPQGIFGRRVRVG